MRFFDHLIVAYFLGHPTLSHAFCTNC